MRSIRKKLLVAAVAALLGSVLTAPITKAEEMPAGIQNILAQAKQEGTVSMFTGSTRYTQDNADKLSKAMQAKFGFPITVKLEALGPHPSVIQRIATEYKTGIKDPPVDLLPSALALIKILRQANAIAPVDWKALGIAASKVMAPGDNVAVSTIARGIIYNTNLVKPGEAPKTFQDLLNPKWKGKIVAPAIGDVFALLVPVMGEQEAYSFVRKLVNDQKLVLIHSVSDVDTKVINGEYAIGYAVPANWTGQQKKGAPVANARLNKVSGQTFNAVVLANAKHAAAAELFTYFICCTVEGQKVLYDTIGWANFDTPGTEQFEIGGHGRGIYPSVDWQLKEQGRIAKKMAQILGL
jgi:ABC-type Fe3+ transport system substrate-binding protein